MGTVYSTSYTSNSASSTSSSNLSSSYTAPSYAEDYMDDKMKDKNDRYNQIIADKNTFFSTFYGKVSTIFSDTNMLDLTSTDVSASSTYAEKTGRYEDNISSTDGYRTLLNTNDEVQKKRMKMDADISRINSSRNINNKNDPGILYNAHFYVNLLWIILATTLIYYIFTEI